MNLNYRLTVKSLKFMVRLIFKYSKFTKKDVLILLKSFLHHWFSNDCILISLELNLAFHLREEFSSLKFYDKYSSCCLTLRHLYLHLVYICVLDDIIQCVSSLETLRISCQDSIKVEPYEFEQAVMLFQSDTNWKYKVRFRKVNLWKSLIVEF